MPGPRSTSRGACALLAGSAALLLGLLAACGGSDPTGTRSRAPGEPTSPPSGAPTRPASVVPLAQRLEARIRIKNADGLTTVGGYVWARTDDGRLVRVDPRSNRVGATMRLDERGLENRYCQGVGTDGESVWTCATNARTTPVVRIDPATGRVAETFDVDKVFDQLTLPFAFGRLWVLTGDGSTLSGLVPGDGYRTTYSLAARCAQVAPSDGALVLTCPLDDAVRRIDPDSGRVLARVEVRHPFVVSAAGDSVWVGSSDGLQRLDAGTLRPLTVFRGMSPGLAGDIVARGEAVWVRREGAPFLARLDRTSSSVTELVRADASLSGGSLLVTRHAIWTTAYDDGVLLRLRR